MSKLKSNKIFKKVLTGLCIVIGILILIILLITVPFLNRIYPNISVSGIYVGDKTKNIALQKLQTAVNLPDKFILNSEGKTNEILTSEIVTGVDYAKSIDRAFNFTNTGNFWHDTFTRISLIFEPIDLSLDLNINDKRLLESILIISEKTGSKPIYPSAKLINGQILIDAGTDGVEVETEKLIAKIKLNLSYIKNEAIEINLKKVKAKLNPLEVENYKNTAEDLIGKKIELKLDFETFVLDDKDLVSFLTPTGFSDELIKVKIAEISKKLNRSPQDSIFVVENEKVTEFAPSEDGLTVDEDLLLSLIKDLPSEITIPVVKVAPKIKNEDVNNLGIKTLLGRGFSNFKGSIPNRIHNVNHAQSKFKGVLISPGETISFNQILGDVSSLTGYKSAYVIMDGKTVLGDGGGVCQVSTTLFRAVLSAGLPVIERRAHAYRVGYYEQGFGPGLDATVYSPTTDFKFKNDTPAYLLIQPEIDLTNLSLTFKIYGTSDGRVATTTKPVVTSSSAPGEDVYQDDPTLKVGVVKQIEHRAYGARVVFDYDVVRGEEVLINQTFVSNYRPWQAVYLRGVSQ